MIGMAYKDFMVLRKQLGYYLAFFLLYGVLSFLGVFDSSIFAALIVVIGIMLPMSSVGYDDQARWDKFAASTPAGRRGVVGGKYLFALLGTLASAIPVVVVMGALLLTGIMKGDLPVFLITVAACSGVSLLMNAVLLPLLLKYGSEKSRTIMILLFVAIFGGSMLLGQTGNLPAIPGWVLSALPVVLVLVVVGAFVISYFISLGIYEKKAL